MNLMASVRSRINSQPEAVFGEGARSPLNKQITAAIKKHIASLRDADLTGYTYEHRHSDFAGARTDLVIYDASSTPVLAGREFNSGPTSIWPR